MIHPARIFRLNAQTPGNGPVICLLRRDLRVRDNWALLLAQEKALELKQPLIVVVCTDPEAAGTNTRQQGFMLAGLREMKPELEKLNIPLITLKGAFTEGLLNLQKKISPGMVVTDFFPLHLHRKQVDEFSRMAGVAVAETDAHNIVPCREASGKAEFGAYTIRPKIRKKLEEFIVEFPELKRHPFRMNDIPVSASADSQAEYKGRWIPGEKAAHGALAGFLDNRISSYAQNRNNPLLEGQSDLSPYLHSGQISAQRIALEVRKRFPESESAADFLEEMIVRRELSDNFCHYNPHYDSFEGFHPWAKKTLNDHRSDRREYLYPPEVFENASTHDPLWNAAQREMILTGKMHGYLRMYWAKKILEWTASPEEAQAVAIHLNDTWSLDGNDPNGYAGIAWSIGGVHDRAWGERPVFGKIRYMNDKGCRRKFDAGKYISKIDALEINAYL